jgi:hypothetical protein
MAMQNRVVGNAGKTLRPKRRSPEADRKDRVLIKGLREPLIIADF